jgi:hypothetical protein
MWDVLEMSATGSVPPRPNASTELSMSYAESRKAKTTREMEI